MVDASIIWIKLVINQISLWCLYQTTTKSVAPRTDPQWLQMGLNQNVHKKDLSESFRIFSLRQKLLWIKYFLLGHYRHLTKTYMPLIVCVCFSYEPELHPGVTYKLPHPKATLKIFSTGSITVTGESENFGKNWLRGKI